MTATRRTAAIAAALALAGLATACGSSAPAASSEVSLGPDATTVTAPSTTAAPTTTAPTTTAPVTTGRGNPEEAAKTLYDAWYAGDKVTAGTVATQTALDDMWQTPKGDYGLYSGCDSAEFDTSGCLFRGANGTIQFTMERRGDLWVVIEALYSPP